MNDLEIALKLLKMAKTLMSDEGRTRLTAERRRLSEDPRRKIKTLPGMGRAKVEGWLRTIVEARQMMAIESKKYEAFLKKMEGLGDVETEAVGKLREAAKQMKTKGKYLLETEEALLQFTAFVEEKRPGVEQMLKNPEDAKAGDKAGALIQRISDRLGAKVASAVEEIYRQTMDELTDTRDLVAAFKVLEKVQGIEASMREAGIADIVVGLRDWLSGEVNALTRKAVGFTGDVTQWAKRFTERTSIVENQYDDLIDVLNKAMEEYRTALRES